MFHWFRKLFHKTPKTETPAYQVMESIYGTWHYHLARRGGYIALCGAKVMNTNLSLDHWGVKTHIGEHWCAECVRQADLKA